ncbi:MAG: DNA polymerase ligase N-terminal domain-containing protein [bacterium]
MSGIFVVHEHHASRLHYDFRLEMDGVLRSWAMPKGPSMDPSQKRLAVQVEDHPLEYADFEGIIPQGQYGAGPVLIWDRGSYQLEQMAEGKISVILEGEKLKGGFTLMKMKGRGGDNQWLLVKRKDGRELPGWELVPVLNPQSLASLKERIPPCKAE